MMSEAAADGAPERDTQEAVVEDGKSSTEAYQSKTPLASAESEFAATLAEYPQLRRVVTFAALFAGFPIYWIAASVLLTCYLLFFSRGLPAARVLMAAYLTWIFFFDSQRMHGTGGYGRLTDVVQRRNKSFWLWKVCTAYYPMHVHKTAEIDTKRHPRLLFVVHPHGIFGLSTQGNLGTWGSGLDRLYGEGLAARTRLMALAPLLLLPFMREVLLLCGVSSPSRQSFARLFARGEIPVLNVGGAAESLVHSAGGREDPASEKVAMKVILKHRKGFVRIALRENASLVPCLAFEENLAFAVLRGGALGELLQRRLQKALGFATPLFWGNLLPFHPLRGRQNMYIGAPLDCALHHGAAATSADSTSHRSCRADRATNGTTSREPTQAEVDEKHAEYLEALKRLFEEYKAHAGHPDWEFKVTDETGRE